MQDCTPTPYFPQDLENYAPWVAKYGLLAPYGECQCGCGAATAISHANAKRHGWKLGHPLAYVGSHYQHKPRHVTIESIFWAKVKKGSQDECWDWQGKLNESGYGMLTYNRKPCRAHRFSWEIHNGPIPDGMYVCHSCDRPRCVNISHLWLGTNADNQNDKIEKGRTPKGQDAGPAKLLESDVIEMKRLFRQGSTRKEISAMLGVPYFTLCDLLSGRTWSHVP